MVRHFHCKQLTNHLYPIMFFRLSHNMSQSYDLVYKNIETLVSLHHRFLLYYDNIEGDVEACQCLYKSYLAKRMWIPENDAKKKEEIMMHCEGGVFMSKRAVEFGQRFDDYCKQM